MLKLSTAQVVLCDCVASMYGDDAGVSDARDRVATCP